MDKGYADTVRLLLTVAPEVFANDIFAMKGGTAINLFVEDMPRLSVDIDVVFQPRQMPRDEALAAIDAELAAIARRVEKLGLRTRSLRRTDGGDTKLIVENDAAQVKIEVNTVFRGTLLPVERRPLNTKTADLFGNDKDIAAEYDRTFVGMTEVPCSLDTLLGARAQLRDELPHRLTARHRQFLRGLVRANPDWSLMQHPHTAELPALRWKLTNLEIFRQRRPADFHAQAEALDVGLARFKAPD